VFVARRARYSECLTANEKRQVCLRNEAACGILGALVLLGMGGAFVVGLGHLHVVSK
jgi:hypothetical protein